MKSVLSIAVLAAGLFTFSSISHAEPEMYKDRASQEMEYCQTLKANALEINSGADICIKNNDNSPPCEARKSEKDQLQHCTQIGF